MVVDLLNLNRDRGARLPAPGGRSWTMRTGAWTDWSVAVCRVI
jgi:hypothetical protein